MSGLRPSSRPSSHRSPPPPPSTSTSTAPAVPLHSSRRHNIPSSSSPSYPPPSTVHDDEGVSLAYLVTSAADIVYELEDTETQIGRSDSCDIILKNSKSVSSVHARIIIDPAKQGSAKLIDQSLNGTFINDTRLHNSSKSVSSGDAIRFGYDNEIFRFYFPHHLPNDLFGNNHQHPPPQTLAKENALPEASPLPKASSSQPPVRGGHVPLKPPSSSSSSVPAGLSTYEVATRPHRRRSISPPVYGHGSPSSQLPLPSNHPSVYTSAPYAVDDNPKRYPTREELDELRRSPPGKARSSSSSGGPSYPLHPHPSYPDPSEPYAKPEHHRSRSNTSSSNRPNVRDLDSDGVHHALDFGTHHRDDEAIEQRSSASARLHRRRQSAGFTVPTTNDDHRSSSAHRIPPLASSGASSSPSRPRIGSPSTAGNRSQSVPPRSTEKSHRTGVPPSSAHPSPATTDSNDNGSSKPRPPSRSRSAIPSRSERLAQSLNNPHKHDIPVTIVYPTAQHGHHGTVVHNAFETSPTSDKVHARRVEHHPENENVPLEDAGNDNNYGTDGNDQLQDGEDEGSYVDKDEQQPSRNRTNGNEDYPAHKNKHHQQHNGTRYETGDEDQCGDDNHHRNNPGASHSSDKRTNDEPTDTNEEPSRGKSSSSSSTHPSQTVSSSSRRASSTRAEAVASAGRLVEQLSTGEWEVPTRSAEDTDNGNTIITTNNREAVDKATTNDRYPLSRSTRVQEELDTSDTKDNDNDHHHNRTNDSSSESNENKNYSYTDDNGTDESYSRDIDHPSPKRTNQTSFPPFNDSLDLSQDNTITGTSSAPRQEGERIVSSSARQSVQSIPRHRASSSSSSSRLPSSASSVSSSVQFNAPLEISLPDPSDSDGKAVLTSNGEPVDLASLKRRSLVSTAGNHNFPPRGPTNGNGTNGSGPSYVSITAIGPVTVNTGSFAPSSDNGPSSSLPSRREPSPMASSVASSVRSSTHSLPDDQRSSRTNPVPSSTIVNDGITYQVVPSVRDSTDFGRNHLSSALSNDPDDPHRTSISSFNGDLFAAHSSLPSNRANPENSTNAHATLSHEGDTDDRNNAHPNSQTNRSSVNSDKFITNPPPAITRLMENTNSSTTNTTPAKPFVTANLSPPMEISSTERTRMLLAEVATEPLSPLPVRAPLSSFSRPTVSRSDKKIVTNSSVKAIENIAASISPPTRNQRGMSTQASKDALSPVRLVLDVLGEERDEMKEAMGNLHQLAAELRATLENENIRYPSTVRERLYSATVARSATAAATAAVQRAQQIYAQTGQGNTTETNDSSSASPNPPKSVLLRLMTQEGEGADLARRGVHLALTYLDTIARKQKLRQSFYRWQQVPVRSTAIHIYPDRNEISITPGRGNPNIAISPSRNEISIGTAHNTNVNGNYRFRYDNQDSLPRTSNGASVLRSGSFAFQPPNHDPSLNPTNITRLEIGGVPVTLSTGTDGNTQLQVGNLVQTVSSSSSTVIPTTTPHLSSTAISSQTSPGRTVIRIEQKDPFVPTAEVGTNTDPSKRQLRCLSPPRSVWEADSGHAASTAASRNRTAATLAQHSATLNSTNSLSASVSLSSSAGFRTRSKSPPVLPVHRRSYELSNAAKGTVPSRPGSASSIGSRTPHRSTSNPSGTNNGGSKDDSTNIRLTSTGITVIRENDPSSSSSITNTHGSNGVTLTVVQPSSNAPPPPAPPPLPPTATIVMNNTGSTGTHTLPSTTTVAINPNSTTSAIVPGTSNIVYVNNPHPNNNAPTQLQTLLTQTALQSQDTLQLLLNPNPVPTSAATIINPPNPSSSVTASLFTVPSLPDNLTQDARNLAVQAILQTREEQIRRVMGAADEQIVRLATAAAVVANQNRLSMVNSNGNDNDNDNDNDDPDDRASTTNPSSRTRSSNPSTTNLSRIRTKPVTPGIEKQNGLPEYYRSDNGSGPGMGSFHTSNDWKNQSISRFSIRRDSRTGNPPWIESRSIPSSSSFSRTFKNGSNGSRDASGAGYAYPPVLVSAPLPSHSASVNRSPQHRSSDSTDFPQRRRNTGVVTEAPLLEYSTYLDSSTMVPNSLHQTVNTHGQVFDPNDPLGGFRDEKMYKNTVFQGGGIPSWSGLPLPPSTESSASSRMQELTGDLYPTGSALDNFRSNDSTTKEFDPLVHHYDMQGKPYSVSTHNPSGNNSPTLPPGVRLQTISESATNPQNRNPNVGRPAFNLHQFENENRLHLLLDDQQSNGNPLVTVDHLRAPPPPGSTELLSASLGFRSGNRTSVSMYHNYYPSNNSHGNNKSAVPPMSPSGYGRGVPHINLPLKPMLLNDELALQKQQRGFM